MKKSGLKLTEKSIKMAESGVVEIQDSAVLDKETLRSSTKNDLKI